MISFFLTLFRLLQAIWRAWHDPYFRASGILAVLLLTSGTLFYSAVEGWRWIDALYFSVATLSTVGYGDLVPQTDLGKIFTICFILVGLGVFVTLVTRLAHAMMGTASNARRENGAPADGAEG